MINPTTQTTENNARISCFLGLLFLMASKHKPGPPEESLEASNITGGSTDDCNLNFLNLLLKKHNSYGQGHLPLNQVLPSPV